jgi:hypothetical protein
MLAGDDSFTAVARDLVKRTPRGQPLQMTILPSRPAPGDKIVQRDQTVPRQLCRDCEKKQAGHVPWMETVACFIGTVGLWVKGELPKSKSKADKTDNKTEDKKKDDTEDWVVIN